LLQQNRDTSSILVAYKMDKKNDAHLFWET